MDTYEYLFPYEKVKCGSDVIIYGAGVMGQDYLKQMQITSFCNVIGFIDKNYKNYSGMCVPVYPSSILKKLHYDYVVIALQKADALNEVINVLHQEDVTDNKIVYTLLRNTSGLNVFLSNVETIEKEPAYEGTAYSLALSVTGGIGDMVIHKRFVSELINCVPEIKIDIYAVDTCDFLNFLYSDCKNINIIQPNLGVRYEQSYHRYALSIFIEGTGFVRVDEFKKNIFEESHGGFCEKILKLIEYIKRENASMSTPMYVLNGRRIYEQKNCYTWFSFDGIFSIEDDKIEIPVKEDILRDDYKSILKNIRYITVNYGNGKASDGKMISKAWPIEYFEELVEIIHENNKELMVIQLGTANSKKISGVNRYILGEDFNTVSCLLKYSRLHIDIDGGLVHLASQLDTRCAVLFGPTRVEMYGYKKNLNIVSENCKGCFGLFNNGFKCAKGLSKPECMYSLKPEMVAKTVIDFLGEEKV